MNTESVMYVAVAIGIVLALASALTRKHLRAKRTARTHVLGPTLEEATGLSKDELAAGIAAGKLPAFKEACNDWLKTNYLESAMLGASAFSGIGLLSLFTDAFRSMFAGGSQKELQDLEKRIVERQLQFFSDQDRRIREFVSAHEANRWRDFWMDFGKDFFFFLLGIISPFLVRLATGA